MYLSISYSFVINAIYLYAYPLSTRRRGDRMAVRKASESGAHSDVTVVWPFTMVICVSISRYLYIISLYILYTHPLSTHRREKKIAVRKARESGAHI